MERMKGAVRSQARRTHIGEACDKGRKHWLLTSSAQKLRSAHISLGRTSYMASANLKGRLRHVEDHKDVW